ncbi:MAG: ATP-binding protein [Anaerolineaceae bacterium]
MASSITQELPFDPIQNDLSVLDRSLILELIPFAALIYNRSNDLILAANKKFLELTSRDLGKLLELSLANLVPGDLDTNPTGNDTRPVRLRIASGDLIQANLRIQSLSMTNQIVVLIFSPPESEMDIRKELIDQEIFYDNFSLLTTIGNRNSSIEAISTAAEILKKMVNPKSTAVYLADREGKQLVQVPLSPDLEGNQFPEKTSSELLSALPNLYVWRANKKPLCSLHELALVKGYNYVITLPLTLNGSPQGVMMAAGHSLISSDETMRLLSLLGSQTSSAVQHLLNLENARKTVKTIRQVVQIEHAITDNLEEGIIILTPDLRIAEMSPSAEIMLGYAGNEVFRQKAEMVLIGNETLSTLYKSAQQGISTLVGNNLSLNTRNGKSFMAQVLCIPVMTENKTTSIVLILRDLSQTEQIRARTQQLEQRAFLGEVSAIFAHEVKNPINSIMTGLQYIGMTLKADDPHYDLINRLQNDCLRLTHLMDSTLTFSKPMEYHFVPVDLSDMIPMILERWGPRMKRLNINYNFDANPAHPLVKADNRALEQVFVNLVSNALQAMDSSGGTLNIKIVRADEHLAPPQYEIIVADSGPGIPDDLKEHIFEPFFTTNANGTGLGLAISKRIVTAHKGSIFVESFPGGTMFHILLPKAD